MAIEVYGPKTITIEDGDTSNDLEITGPNGILRTVILETPALTDATASITITDDDDYTIYQATGVAGSSVSGQNASSLARELYGDAITITIEITGAQGTDKDFEVKLIYEKVAG